MRDADRPLRALRRARTALLSLAGMLLAGLACFGCQAPGPAVVVRLNPLTPGADLLQLMVISGEVGQEQVAQQYPTLPIANGGELDFQDYTAGVRLPAGTSGRVIIGAAVYSQASDCLLASGSGTLAVNPITDVNGVELSVLLTPLDVADCGRGLKVPRFVGAPDVAPTVSQGDSFGIRGWGLPPDAILRANGTNAAPMHWESPRAMDAHVPSLPGFLGPLDITLHARLSSGALEQSQALLRYLHLPTFGAAEYTYRTDGSVSPPAAALAADLDGQNGNDLALLWYDAPGAQAVISIMLSKADGTLQPPVYHTVSGITGTQLAAADLDGQKGIDLVMATSSAQLIVLLNQGGGTFPASGTAYPLPAAAVTDVRQLTLADIDHDAQPDALLLYGSGPDLSNLTSQLLIVKGSSGGFGTSSALSLPGSPYSFAAVDLVAAGSADLAVTYAAATSGIPITGVDVLVNQGNGTFQQPIHYPSFGQQVLGADLNRDGRQDLIFPRGALFNQGGAVLLAGADFTASKKTPIAAGYLNGDGEPDVGFVEGFALAAAPGGAIQPGVRPFPGPVFLLADLDRDKLLDLVAVAASANKLTLFRNVSLKN